MIPEPEVWVICDAIGFVDIGLYNPYIVGTSGNPTVKKTIYVGSNSNYLDDAFMVAIDHLNNDSVVEGNILDRNDDGKAIRDFLLANSVSQKEIDRIDFDIYMKPPTIYWYGQQFDKYVNHTQVDIGGKMFTQYSSDEVLPEYSELFSLDNYDTHGNNTMALISDPSNEYIVNSSNNTAYGIGAHNVGALKTTGYANAAFISIGWACKMTKSEFDAWKSYCNTVHIDKSPAKARYQSINEARVYVTRVNVISGTLLK